MSGRHDSHAVAASGGGGSAEEAPCGCHEGAVAAFAALTLLLLQATGLLGLPFLGSGPVTWLGFVFGAALLGKVAGIAVGTLRLRRTAQRIETWEAR